MQLGMERVSCYKRTSWLPWKNGPWVCNSTKFSEDDFEAALRIVENDRLRTVKLINTVKHYCSVIDTRETLTSNIRTFDFWWNL